MVAVGQRGRESRVREGPAARLYSAVGSCVEGIGQFVAVEYQLGLRFPSDMLVRSR